MTRTHTVAWGPRFLPGTSEGPMACCCGWTGVYVKGYRTDTFTEHRAAMGLRTANQSHTLSVPEHRGVFARKDPRPVSDTCPHGHVGRYRKGLDRKRRCLECDRLRKRVAA